MNVSTNAYLIAISGRKRIAQVWGKPIYLVIDVAFIPLSSQKEAADALKLAAQRGEKHNESNVADPSTISDLADDADNDSIAMLEDSWLDEQASGANHSRVSSRTLGSAALETNSSGVAQDVIGRKGLYGRFTERWFSKRGWASVQQRNMGMSSHDNLPTLKSPPQSPRSSFAQPIQSDITAFGTFSTTSPPNISLNTQKKSQAIEKDKDAGKAIGAILPKLVQTLKLLLKSNMFYFSYDFDLTRRCVARPHKGTDIPLFKQCDPQYFWNAHLSEAFVNEGLEDYILPIMQGFVGQRAFEFDNNPGASTKAADAVISASLGEPRSVADVAREAQAHEKTSFLLTVISRKSIRRAGFRYMRRGIDENGNVANCVETEQLLSSPTWIDRPVRSFVQIRGSIPLFYSQTPYNFKPTPSLHSTREANQRALRSHFTELATEYGEVQAVSLIDRHGGELAIGNEYEGHAKLLNEHGGLNGRTLQFDWFDFHDICRGMKFENVSLLIETLKPFLETIGWSDISDSHGKCHEPQRGIIRTNCMDCLDRTNVVQSAIAQHVLAQQLAQYLQKPGESGNATPDPTSTAFNALWADNGDALSLAYAGTAALKGDYVRTRRRNLAGLLTDLSLTLSRFYRNLFDDFFAQAVLDFVLGNVGESIFAEFRERMTTADPSIDLERAREMAIASAWKVVVDEREDLLGGWTISAPTPFTDGAANITHTSIEASQASITALRSQPFREMLLLLSDTALYSVSYDWDTEKVRGFERIPLGQIKRLQFGTYIAQTLTTEQQDPEQNVGLLIGFEPDSGQPYLRRVNTRTIGAVDGLDNDDDPPVHPEQHQKVLAYKVLPRSANSFKQGDGHGNRHLSEKRFAREVCRIIQQAAGRQTNSTPGPTPTVPGKNPQAEERCPPDEGAHAKQVMSKEASSLLSGGVQIEEKAIVSLEQAQKATTIIEQVGYGLKRLIWG